VKLNTVCDDMSKGLPTYAPSVLYTLLYMEPTEGILHPGQATMWSHKERIYIA